MLTDNPWLKRFKDASEEQLGRLTAQLLSNDKFVAAIQVLVSRSLSARENVEKALRGTLSAMNLPTTEDLAALRTKVEGLETLLSSIERKVDALGNQKKRGQGNP